MNVQQELEILRELKAARARGDTRNEERLRSVLEESYAAAKAPKAGERNFAEEGLIGLGSGLSTAWEGAKQLVGASTPAEQAEFAAQRREYEQTPVGQSVAGNIGEFVGEGLPYMAIPGGAAGGLLRRMATSAVGGGLAGAGAFIDPTDPSQSRLANAGMGAAFGAAIPGVMGGVNKWLTPREGVPQARADLLELGRKHHVPVMTSDLPEASRTLVVAENLIEGQPFGMEKARRAQAEAMGAAADMQTAVQTERLRLAAEKAGWKDEAGNLMDVRRMDPADVVRMSAQRQLGTEKGIANDLYGRIEQASAVAGPMHATATRAALDEAIAKASAGALPDMGAVKQLQAVADYLGEPRTFSDLQKLHSDLGDVVSGYYKGAANQAIGEKGVGIIQGVKNALDTELTDLAASSDVPQLDRLWKAARQHYREKVAPYHRPDIARLTSDKSDADEVLRSFMKKGELTDRLQRMYAAMDPVGREAVKKGAIDDAIKFATDPSNGTFMPGKFAQHLSDRKGVLDTFFKDDPDRLDGLMRLAGYIKRAGHTEANPPTGMRAIPLFAAWMSGGALPLAAAGVSQVLQNPRAVEALRAIGQSASSQKMMLGLGALNRMFQAQSPTE